MKSIPDKDALDCVKDIVAFVDLFWAKVAGAFGDARLHGFHQCFSDGKGLLAGMCWDALSQSGLPSLLATDLYNVCRPVSVQANISVVIGRVKAFFEEMLDVVRRCHIPMGNLVGIQAQRRCRWEARVGGRILLAVVVVTCLIDTSLAWTTI